MSQKIATVVGTRPEIIKLSSLIPLFDKKFEHRLIHTGQHYSYELDKLFFEELELRDPDFTLEVGSGTHAYQTGEVMKKLEKIFLKEKIDLVVVEGDTNSVLASALAAIKLHIPVAHVEAGIRSFNRKMPEEINRLLTDQISEYCFAPTPIAVNNLKRENVSEGKIYLVGNTIVEVTRKNLELAKKKSNIMKQLNLEKEGYVLLTAHRCENVDIKSRVIGLRNALEQIDLPVVYPIHPRSLKMIQKFNLLKKFKQMDNLEFIKPIGFFDFLSLSAHSKFIITDSGGIQEECTVYKKPVLIIRDDTERPEILGTFGRLVGCDTKKIVEESERILDNYSIIMKKLRDLESPFGDGTTSKRILEILSS